MHLNPVQISVLVLLPRRHTLRTSRNGLDEHTAVYEVVTRACTTSVRLTPRHLPGVVRQVGGKDGVVRQEGLQDAYPAVHGGQVSVGTSKRAADRFSFYGLLLNGSTPDKSTYDQGVNVIRNI